MLKIITDKTGFFSLIAISVFLEAFPFLLVGSLLSSFCEVFVSPEQMKKFIPRRKDTGILYGLFIGILLPICECGTVPITKRLIRKGVPAYIAISYMLAAPVVNPLVMISTYIAFRNNFGIVIWRVLIVCIIAAIVSWIISFQKDDLLLADSASSAAHCCGQSIKHSKIRRIMAHTCADFLEMGKYLILGAFASAFFQCFIPRNFLMFFANNIFLSIIGMMVLAVLLSICSEADSFVAASFSRFPLISQMAFITIGPMLDLKLIAMYGATFRRRIVIILVFASVLLNLLICNILGLFIR